MGEDLGEGGLPVKSLWTRRPVADDAVALANGVVEAGQLFAARGGLDPEAELADLDGLLVQVHAVEVVLRDLPVEIEEGALAAQLFQPGVGESDVQTGVARVNGAELAAEVVPDRVRIVGVVVHRGGTVVLAPSSSYRWSGSGALALAWSCAMLCAATSCMAMPVSPQRRATYQSI